MVRKRSKPRTVKVRGSLAGTTTELTLEETQALRECWRRIYALPLKRSKGIWQLDGYDWHVFSFHHTFALERDEASRAYAREEASELVFLPNDEAVAGCAVTGIERAPAFNGEDITVAPRDFSWTMSFTHEDGSLGPFFSRAVWVEDPPCKTGKRCR